MFFSDPDSIEQHMKKHAAILKPKFEMVLSILDSRLGDRNIAKWSRPNGGYFISLDTLPGCASAVVKMAGEAGVVLTPAGATFPYGKRPTGLQHKDSTDTATTGRAQIGHGASLHMHSDRIGPEAAGDMNTYHLYRSDTEFRTRSGRRQLSLPYTI